MAKQKTSGEYAEAGARAVRPRDASTLIIIRHDASEPRILMGKRAAGHKFMPNKFVFPGGRVDTIDTRLKSPFALKPDVLTRLRKHVPAHVTDARLYGLALAAIRETFEETGLVLGCQTDTPLKTHHPEWQRYFDHKVVPPLHRLEFIARAITPTYRTRRFDTRFFMGDAQDIHSNPENMGDASGELLDIHWLSLAQARNLDIPIITRQMLDIVEARLNAPSSQIHDVPLFRFRNGKTQLTLL